MKSMVAHAGFEPAISALRGRRPGPLDECATLGKCSLVAELGFEPRLTDPESVVLPLHHSATPLRLYQTSLHLAKPRTPRRFQNSQV